MKTKKLAKRLVLNKLTVTNLSKKEMQEEHGGYSDTCKPAICPTYFVEDCTRFTVCATNESCWTYCVPYTC